MSSSNLAPLPRLILATGLGLLMASCISTKSSGNGGTVTKVNPYHLHDITKPLLAADPSFIFERNALLHGAISNTERLARQGDYFTIFWKVDDRTQPVTVLLEYRTKVSGMAIKSVSQEVTDVNRKNVTKFALIGQDFVTNGPVIAWRVSLMRGKDVITRYNSYLWE